MSDEDISWAAHVGGFVAGAILVLFLRRRGVPLFDRAIVTPKSVETEAPRVTAQGAGGTEPPSWGRG